MKQLLLIITLSLISINSFSKCNIKVDTAITSDYMGHYELMDSFNDRGYWKSYYNKKSVDYSIKFNMIVPYVCSQSRTSILDSIGKPLNRMIMTVTDKEGESKSYETGMRFYYMSKRSEKKAIKRLIKKLPKCTGEV
jgi:hypothetical protein